MMIHHASLLAIERQVLFDREVLPTGISKNIFVSIVVVVVTAAGSKDISVPIVVRGLYWYCCLTTPPLLVAWARLF
jgi:hypothetical protein